MPFRIVHGNIVDVQADAIVNAANTRLWPGGGVCGAIFEAAGYERLLKACQSIGQCEVGHAVATPAFDLKAKYIIHTPGPIWMDGEHGEAELLASCYTESMACALAHGCRSIAFPLISAGIFGYPKQAAYQVAREAITKFIAEHDIAVELVIYESGDDITGYRNRRLEMLIEELFRREDEDVAKQESKQAHRAVPVDHRKRKAKPELEADRASQILLEPRPPRLVLEAEKPFKSDVKEDKRLFKAEERVDEILFKEKNLDDALKNKEESFSTVLLEWIDRKGAKPADIYRRANIDRKHFSKIKGNPDYMPSKQTAVSFAIALELSITDTQMLLRSAGYVLSMSSRFDIIVEYFIEHEIYDIYTINDALFHYNQPLLGSF